MSDVLRCKQHRLEAFLLVKRMREVAPAMLNPNLNPNHPTAVLRQAWRVVRLDTIRRVACKIIVEMEEESKVGLSPETDRNGLPNGSLTATAAALTVCCDEMRTEVGLSAPGQKNWTPGHDMDDRWRQQYLTELARYRGLAGGKLAQLLLDRA